MLNLFSLPLALEAWNVATGWRWMFASESVPALLLLAFLFFVPESPRWLMQQVTGINVFHIDEIFTVARRRESGRWIARKTCSQRLSSLCYKILVGEMGCPKYLRFWTNPHQGVVSLTITSSM